MSLRASRGGFRTGGSRRSGSAKGRVEAPGVREAAVFGVDVERWGQRVCAAVVGDATPGQVIEHARAHLAAIWSPDAIWSAFIDSRA